MTTAPDVNAPPVGEHGAPCAVCAAPLASDQRYCLSCGYRRAEARLPFREILATGAVAGAVRPAAGGTLPVGRVPADEGRRSAVTALASIACLLLALGVGVLIGGSGDPGGQDAAPAPQVISVGGAAGAVAPAGDAGAGPGGSSGKGAKATRSGSEPAGQKQQLQKLEKLSPAEYQKQSQKLPKVVGTGGTPPPKDNKPAAGGGGFQEIG